MRDFFGLQILKLTDHSSEKEECWIISIVTSAGDHGNFTAQALSKIDERLIDHDRSFSSLLR